ncbi:MULTISPECIES: SAF domain-containing protein [unclassified Brachybacterium]|uniref:SAF domain-containing protein n=1 Tax=unclassified Brachybacterium TaxID=2623841 RepID=UPI00360C4D2C
MFTRFRAHLPAWRRALRRRRRTLMVLAVALLAATLVPTLLPPASQGTPVVIAGADLPAGTVLEPGHLRTVRVAAELVPDGTAQSPAEVLGQETALAVPSGTPILSGLLDGGAAAIPEGSSLLAVPVPAVLTPHLGPGSEIEVLTSSPVTAGTTATPARVVELSEDGEGEAAVLDAGSAGQAYVLVAVDRSRTAELARAIGEGAVTISIIG